MDGGRTEFSFIESESFRIIEVFALWEGRINSTYLQNILGVGRQKASEIVARYQAIMPLNLQYDASLKGYCPTVDFSPAFSQGSFDEYSQTLARSCYCDYLSVNQTGFALLEAPLRNISPVLVRPIMRAIREKLRLDIGYTSMSSPDYEARIISPHCIVFNGTRWHVRAWCEKNHKFLDFVLSRFNGEYEFEGPATQAVEQDEKWNTWLDVIIAPDPRLEANQRRIIELDFQMEKGQRSIPVRAALASYLLQRLRLDHYASTAEAQQIIITPESLKQIKPYLF
ncbi:MAG: WYL domain-containing protein [Pontibacterium sp.]